MTTGNLEDLKSCKFWLAVLAEIIGTVLLVIFGCGACSWSPTISIVQIALAFGLSVGSVVWAIAHVSGGHINPAVTVGFLVSRKISLVKAIFFIVGQCIGATVGAVALFVTTPYDPDGNGNSSASPNPGLGTSTPSEHVSSFQVVLIEGIITFLLVFVVFATCDGRRKGFSGSGPLAIGLSVTMGHLWAVPFTGAGTNPARVFGPALISGTWTMHWAYWVGPMFGGATAAIMYDLMFATNASQSKIKSFFTSISYDDSDFDEPEHETSSRRNETEFSAIASKLNA